MLCHREENVGAPGAPHDCEAKGPPEAQAKRPFCFNPDKVVKQSERLDVS